MNEQEHGLMVVIAALGNTIEQLRADLFRANQLLEQLRPQKATPAGADTQPNDH
jgi:hypothetical protein